MGTRSPCHGGRSVADGTRAASSCRSRRRICSPGARDRGGAPVADAGAARRARGRGRERVEVRRERDVLLGRSGRGSWRPPCRRRAPAGCRSRCKRRRCGSSSIPATAGAGGVRGPPPAVTRAAYEPDTRVLVHLHGLLGDGAERGRRSPWWRRIVWHATWSASTGEGGDLGYLSTTLEARDLAVAEVQALITGSDPEPASPLPFDHSCQIPKSTSAPSSSSRASPPCAATPPAASKAHGAGHPRRLRQRARLQMVASAIKDLEEAVANGRGRIADSMTLNGLAAVAADDPGIVARQCRAADLGAGTGAGVTACPRHRRPPRRKPATRRVNAVPPDHRARRLMTLTSAQLRHVADELRAFAGSLGAVLGIRQPGTSPCPRPPIDARRRNVVGANTRRGVNAAARPVRRRGHRCASA